MIDGNQLSPIIPTGDPFDDSFDFVKVAGFEPACLVMVRLKGRYYRLGLEEIPVIPLLDLEEITEGSPKPIESLAMRTVAAISFISGHWKETELSLRCVRNLLPIYVGGLVNLSQSNFSYIEFEEANPLTNRRNISLTVTDCQSVAELIDCVKNVHT